MLGRALRPMGKVARNGVRNYHGEAKPYKYATMDECPVPSGSWKEYYDKKQKLYNVQLVAGLAFFGLAFTIAKTSDTLYMNLSPKVPEGYVPPKYYD